MNATAGGVRFQVVIPARLGSTRLPRKVLKSIAGKPVVQYVWEAARASGAQRVIIAVDDPEVEAVARGFGAEVRMTRRDHPSGSDRVNEVAQIEGWAEDSIVVNLQGDEPLMPPATIALAAHTLAADPGAHIATLCHALHDRADWLNPNVVKVVADRSGRALYFSRAPIPWQRDGGSADDGPAFPSGLAFRHIGLYAYRVGGLGRICALPPAELEQCEALEQLRALANGFVIRLAVTAAAPPRGVDTEADFEDVARRLLQG